MKKYSEFILLPSVILLSACFVLSGCDDKEVKAPLPQPHVGVVTLKAEPLQVTTELPGRTDAYRVAEVRPQVGGIILKRNFAEGSDIRGGESLYQIDPAPYKAAYDSAQGELAKAVAAAKLAHLTVQRDKPLVGDHYVSQQEFDTAVANAQQADADVQAARANVETARINLAYTKVTSPIDGRIGQSNVTEGALVTTEQANALATVQQLDPIYVDVTQSSNDFIRLKQAVIQGSLEKSALQTQVTLVMENGQPYPLKGQLQFSDVSVDESTGSITIRALFPNPQHDLLPGMFVRARIDEGMQKDALLVPQQGVTRNPRGEASVMLVNAKSQVEVRNVTAAQAIGDKWLVTDGLHSGDRVIVSGLQKVRPEMTVKAEEQNLQANASQGQ
ncbi:MAG: efflux RND transporter periplasmic adaptor subunit [Hafnia sp.]|uniref:Efflux RND transporter periplasmic adaptor subunit n=1 Tax=Hafnia alvei TaxID=569 RepID=A0ABD7QC27_HAFAL|nr:efflux RND transporter periplasmic adaptor subunit [Hafnia alvei]ANC39200.1 efflux transporter periplasmic adaptor subunit [Hafnia alvei]KAA0264409.1 efflux RND transporter periplasmic adaptor subunit [Hafnia alvei]MBI0275870.1 efflux RND transporter periplasmic adaptor subunit [Hafnia alvei]MCE9872204.1 efflux RND transporter periplasmic adaptor subunit [Hafnia alvei]PNK98066.1 efflux RND transporter periplasmic adaptor subunit [Hafnia alvei]